MAQYSVSLSALSKSLEAKRYQINLKVFLHLFFQPKLLL